MSGYKENIPSDNEDDEQNAPITMVDHAKGNQNKGALEVFEVDDDVMDAYEQQEDNLGDGIADSDSGFQTFDEGSVKDDESFNDGEITLTKSDAITHFDDHQDSVYCVAILEQPEKDGSILFVSGDGRDQAYVWTVCKDSVLKQRMAEAKEKE